MPLKRKRNASVPPKGLAPGEQLKRKALPGGSSSGPWSWVGTEVSHTEDITLDHRLLACNLLPRDKNASCHNKFSSAIANGQPIADQRPPPTNVNGELDDDIIIISDDDEPTCSKKKCKNNPYCLNYLGQEDWEDEGESQLHQIILLCSCIVDEAQKDYLKAANLGSNPLHLSREPGLPVGLKASPHGSDM